MMDGVGFVLVSASLCVCVCVCVKVVYEYNRRIYDGRERLAPQLSHALAPARRTARKQVIPSGVQRFRFGDG